jgi:hypothetical protein
LSCSLGDVGELQLALGLGVAVRTEELKAQPERLEELLVSMQETNVVVQAKEVMKQLPRSLMLGLSQVKTAIQKHLVLVRMLPHCSDGGIAH